MTTTTRGVPRDYDVVIPTTGRSEEFLEAALHSILRQTVPATRVIVVVDGAPRTAERLRQRGEVTVVEHTERKGQAAARQTGIEAATSTWIAFLDDDDLWRLNKQERLFDFLDAHPDCAAVRAGYWMFSSDGRRDGLFGQVPELTGTSLEELEAAAATARPVNNLEYLDIQGRSLELLLERNRGVIGTSLVSRELLQSLPPVPQGLAPGDEHLLFCHVAAKAEWYLLEERLQFYRLHSSQDTRNKGAGPAMCLLRAKRLAWEAHGHVCARPLVSYGRLYRDEVRGLCWTVLKQTRDLRAAFRVYNAGLPLLPRRRDRLLAAVPEPVVWRLRNIGQRAIEQGAPWDSSPTW